MAKKASDKKRAKCIADAEKHGLKKAAKMNRVSMQAIRNWQAKSEAQANQEPHTDATNPTYNLTYTFDKKELEPAKYEYDRDQMEKLLNKKIDIISSILRANTEIDELAERIERLVIERDDVDIEISRLRSTFPSDVWIPVPKNTIF